MIKLLSLEGFLNLSSDTVKKVGSELSAAGLVETEKFDDSDDFIDAVIDSVDRGMAVVVAAEIEEYNSVKKQLIETFSLRSCQSQQIQNAVLESRKGFAEVQNLEGHCLAPLDSDVYTTYDGLYSGFCVEFSNGARMILLPLDEIRLMDIMPYVIKELEAFVQSRPPETPADDEEEDSGIGIFAQMAIEQGKEMTEKNKNKNKAESDAENSVAEENGDILPIVVLKSGEKLVIDDNADEADLTGFEEAITAAAKTAFALINLDKRVAFVASTTSPFLHAMFDEVDGLSETFSVNEVELDNESELEVQVALAKKARIAIMETGADFAAAISPVIKGERNGKDIYYSYIIIHDGASAKAKKVTTATIQGIQSLIPHAFAVMFGLIERKAESIALLESDSFADDSEEKTKKTALLAVCIACAAVAIASAVVMVWNYFQTPPEMLISTAPPVASDATASPSATPTQNFGSNQIPTPVEPPATDVTNIPTSVQFSSTKGTFTFTVYGYGHGVGMSQNGANYYAGMGKSYLEILAMYYYGATLVLGDTTPKTVKYGGEEYTLRDYLAKALESEMGNSFNPEALKAQAVAIYTFAKHNNFNVQTSAHAFNKEPTQPCYDAVDVVMGQYMTYNGEVALPYFHATSAGKTTSNVNAFGGTAIPYLSGGRPSYGDINAKDYCTTVTFTSDEISALVYSKTGKTLTGDPANWFKILSHDSCINENTGYVSQIQVGDETYSGYDFRLKVLGGALRSHCFTFIYTPTS